MRRTAWLVLFLLAALAPASFTAARPKLPRVSRDFKGPDGTGESLAAIVSELARDAGLNLVVRGTLPGKMVVVSDGKKPLDVLMGLLDDLEAEHELKDGTLTVYGEGASAPPPPPPPLEVPRPPVELAEPRFDESAMDVLQKKLHSLGAAALTTHATAPAPAAPAPARRLVGLREPRETHLANIRQLTFGGQNAEAYFSPDGQWLIFQSTRDGSRCDQIYIMRTDGSQVRRLSTGKGRCTCSYVYPDLKRFLYSSTHLVSPDCPPPPDRSKGYVWPLYPYDIFVGRLDKPEAPLARLTRAPGYDAEATISPDGKTIVFTSDRDGDLELYTMDLTGKNVRRLTHTPGYDGGAFFSPDSRRIVYRADHPKGEALARYRKLLKRHLVSPMHMELRVMNADGTGDVQVTRNGAANFAPYFHPDGKRIIFSSNMLDASGRSFELYLIGVDGLGLERITYDETFNAFPMFSPDGKKLAFSSNRNGKLPHETNVFIADWVEGGGPR